MLEIIDLYGGWGPTTINEGVSFTVAKGEAVALIGRNGVGKTTLMELIVGRADRRSGMIRLDDVELSGHSIHKRSLAGIGYVPQNRETFPSLTVQEHLDIAFRPGRWTPARLYEMFPSLAARRNSLALHLSGGEQQMLAIARALAGNPKVLLMDEPSEGLAPIVVEMLVEAMRALVGDGSIGLFLVEQKAELAASLSHRCMVMDRGRIVEEFASADFLAGRVSGVKIVGLA